MGDVLGYLKEDKKEIKDSPVTPEALGEMINLIENGTISGKIAKEVFEEVWKTGKPPKEVIEEKGLVQITDAGALETAIEEVLKSSPAQLEQYKQGKEKLFGYFVGQVMKATKGKANPKLVNEILRKKLSE
jgi:aspartyl-tRNA(Asn)/glutamyl-tRNA(Gln) amidotransferase subunit B